MMQRFCEECGAKLAAGVSFCENCGAKIQVAAAKDQDEQLEHGIIYTDVSKIAATMNASIESVQEILDGFIASSQSRGIDYALCGAAASNSAAEHVNAIKNAAAQNNAKYVFIIGGWDVVPQQIWQNPAGDSDKEVPSDLPYSVLSTTDPASGVKYDFDSALRVGRLPVYKGESIECFRTYFENVTLHSGKFSSHVTFGETALEWKPTSECIYNSFKNGSLVCSPDYTCENVGGQIPENSNLLFFNVHGSDQAEFWYGQDGGSYPKAFSPQNMRSLVTPNFVGVEACYGARYNGYSSDKSVVQAALETKCLALFGSSKIAFGVPGSNDHSVSCADIIVGEFLRNIKDGMTSGDAAALARKVFWQQAQSDSEIKTMMEFDLYGDPTSRMKATSEKSVSTKSVFSKGRGTAKSWGVPSLAIAMPDITRAIRVSLARTNEKINEQVNRYIWDAFKEVQGVAPKTYSVQCGMKTQFKNVYSKKSGGFESSIIAYYEASGKITQVLGTK